MSSFSKRSKALLIISTIWILCLFIFSIFFFTGFDVGPLLFLVTIFFGVTVWPIAFMVSWSAQKDRKRNETIN
jgi:hypothetical protein